MGLAIGLYRPQGFQYPLVFTVDQLHIDGQPFTLYLNSGKALAGYMVLSILLIQNSRVIKPFINSFYKGIVITICASAAILLLAYHILELKIYPKEINYILLFATTNLLITCIAEEAFMRIVFQRETSLFISSFTQNRYWIHGLPLLLTTFLFSVTHTTGLWRIDATYLLAGLSYGIVFMLTQRVTYAITCHFFVNIVHFSFLTYPI